MQIEENQVGALLADTGKRAATVVGEENIKTPLDKKRFQQASNLLLVVSNEEFDH